MIQNFDTIDHEKYMAEALKEAELAGIRGDKPIGAVIVHGGNIIARSSNRFHTLQSPVAHAETTAIFACAPYLEQYKGECTLYTTVEPCVMCLGTIVIAGIRHIVFGVKDKFMQMDAYFTHPYIRKKVHHYVGDVLRDECVQVLQKYSPRDAEIVLTGKWCPSL
nr:putative cytosine/adenosine deaminase [uncultured bacterium]